MFDFVAGIERVEFPEALRMLAERAGITLDDPVSRAERSGPSKAELLAVTAWAGRAFAAALADSSEALAYLQRRGISPEAVERFGLGYAPDERGWLLSRARTDGHAPALLDRAGLVARLPEAPQSFRERFRGRLMFPIRDGRGRPIAFGGRILPTVERRLAELGKGLAKYVNSPETPLFQKRRTLYAADLARDASRQSGWVAVVEGYTDVIAAHQAGLTNVVGTLGTALGADHLTALRRLADRVVLVFDGDEAGQKAADRALELFLGHELDLRVLTLPPGIDPDEFLAAEGADAFRARVDQAADPLDFALNRAAARFDFDSVDGARQAADWVLSILGRVPNNSRAVAELKVAKALDTLADRLRLPEKDLRRWLKQKRRADKARPARPAGGDEPGLSDPVSELTPIRPEEFDSLYRDMVLVVLHEPSVVSQLITCVTLDSLKDKPLRDILQICFDLHGEGSLPTFDSVLARLGDPGLRALAHDFLQQELPSTQLPKSAAAPLTRKQFLAAALGVPTNQLDDHVSKLPESELSKLHLEYFESLKSLTTTARNPWLDQFSELLPMLAKREIESRIRDVELALKEIDPLADPGDHQALREEWLRLRRQRDQKPAQRKRTAS